MRPVHWIPALAVLATLLAWQTAGPESPSLRVPAEPARLASKATAPQPASDSGNALNDVRALPDPGQTGACDFGGVGDDDDAKDAERLQRFEAATGQARQVIAARLLGDPDAFAQAAGVVVQSLIDADDRRDASHGSPTDETCAGPTCPEIMARADVTARVAEDLSRRASQSLDPRVYGLAFRACFSAGLWQKSEGNCSLLSLEQWSRVDPDNGAPWLYSLRNAADGNQEALVDEALFHLAKAKRFNDNPFAVAGEIARHAEDESTLAPGAFRASLEAFGLGVAMWQPLEKLVGACRGEALADANRRQLCEGVADALVERSDNLLMASTGVGMGRRLGWGPERGDALRGIGLAAADAGQWHLDSTHGNTDTGCSGLKQDLRRITREAVVGEAGWAREWLAANSRTEKEYTQRAREARLQREAAGQATLNGTPVASSAAASSSR